MNVGKKQHTSNFTITDPAPAELVAFYAFVLYHRYALTLKPEGGGALYTHPLLLSFCLLLKKSLGNPYLKILDF